MKIPIQSIYNFYRNAIRNPKYRWWIILGTLVYLLSPFDISPDFFPIVGEIDDFILVTFLVTEVSQLILDRFKSTKTNPVAAPTETSNETIEVQAVSAE
ncbi:MAG: DUF1232 domain-containing protein [Hydrococcus sp. C42_A2020_068]|uniref:YkvA family protein n=1 Tax=Pleurocapsa sp. PCC 7327 TaxID=118163 RepID=UPI00029FAB6F|nr:YkvA family protein [Pleurocapsa sp. PCC 7327]AFY78280.1 hypothetical protein Ple7327_3048 [Pleurocapsa sp. PCC 7327]MBF2020084.1 DUF1232 domain-containing protein [Hydrococcus sp. C42_A2020_068]